MKRTAFAVLLPFAATRAALLAVSAFARRFPGDALYPTAEAVSRGWSFTPDRLLDVFGRWDTGWYLGIAMNGYAPAAPGAESNLAFFPAFPAIVGALWRLLPASLMTERSAFLIALVVANAALVASLFVLHRLAEGLLGEGQRAVVLLLAWPLGFVLSCAYSESLLLLFTLLALDGARRHRWIVAGLAAFAATLTRSTGMLVIVPLAWMWLEERQFSLRRIDRSALALLGVPAGLGVLLALGAAVAEDPLATVHAQAAWGRGLSSPWQTLLDPLAPHPSMTPLDRALLGAGLALSVVAWRALPTKAYALFGLASLLPPLLSGTLMSGARFTATLVPAFLALAWLARRREWELGILLLALPLQAVVFVAWARFYWVG